MNAKALIQKKRDGGALEEREVRFFVDGAVSGAVEPYQVTAWLMAVFFRGMTPEETAFLTRAMIDSGRRIEFGAPRAAGHPARLPVDKHSTGGVGDKLSFLVAPIAAAHGVPVPMISGRSLGHTGGTLDKLESIPGFRTALSAEEFIAQVEELGICLAGQSEDLVPADRLFYALRDAASIVESVPLITASILSKKAAEGARGLVLDVKVGTGAFMGTLEDGRALARSLVRTSQLLGLHVHAFLTRMDHVLGHTAGNALEVRESIEGLRTGHLSRDLEELTVALGGEMLRLGGAATDSETGRVLARETLANGRAFEVFRTLVESQGGDPRAIDDPQRLPRADRIVTCAATRGGTFQGLDARGVGDWITSAGGGRLRTSDVIDPVVGVESLVELGTRVDVGTPLLRLHLPTDPARMSEDDARQAAGAWPRITESAGRAQSVTKPVTAEEFGPSWQSYVLDEFDSAD